MEKRSLLLTVMFMLFWAIQGASGASPRAFPTAEGEGRWARGGRGGDVYHVTNLNNSGYGSLRYGIDNASGPRTIVFDVSGTIYLSSRLLVDTSYLTIAGQTAPGDGICIANNELRVNNANHIIIRHLRSRCGNNGNRLDEEDCLTVANGKNVMIDHCSLSWGNDEIASVGGYSSSQYSDNVTYQWCIISEALNYAGHPYASLIRGCYGIKISFHHNLFAHSGRCPRPGNYYDADTQGWTFDFRNNVMYNCGGKHAGYNADGDNDVDSITKSNFINNCYIKGNNANSTYHAFGEYTTTARGYFSGNWFDGSYPSDPWSIVKFYDFTTSQKAAYKQSSPYSVQPVTTHNATTAYNRVLDYAGATYPDRDSVDDRIVSDVENGTGYFINDEADVGGWPYLQSYTPYPDSDGDGMPNFWENCYGLNPNNAADRNYDPDGDGYTNLEEYLSWRVNEGDGPR
ncbi:MAG: hypothetical protein K8R02_09265 [Anaerohalosphaeraceae bacterium]|nr:hypothetical protein [Anaerohalosphaeraceae bacterium]